ncbi:MAG: aminotransferase class III-fold pyridoxal phosphate-dependent enzyme [Pseudomonadota bacterium]
MHYVDCDLRGGTLLAGHAPTSVVAKLADHLGAPQTGARDRAAIEKHAILLRRSMPWVERIIYTATHEAAMRMVRGVARAATGRQRIADLSLDNPIDDIAVAGVTSLSDPAAAMVIRAPNGDPAEAAIGRIKAVIATCREAGTLVIIDDRGSGLITTPGGFAGRIGVVPDLAVLGGIIGGGLPLAAVVGSAEVIDRARRSAQATAVQLPLAGDVNALAAVAGQATLEMLEAPGARDRLFETGRAILQSAERAIGSMPVPARLTGNSTCFSVHFEADTADMAHRLARRFDSIVEARGVLQADRLFYVSLAHDAEAIAHTVAAIAGALESVADLAERLTAAS